MGTQPVRLKQAVRSASGLFGWAPLSHRVGLLLSLSLLSLGVTREAQAYCRTRTCEFPEKDVPCEYDEVTGCSTVGEFLFWRDKCIPFAVDRAGSLADDIAAEDVERLVTRGFEIWSDLSCSAGGSPELAAGSQGRIACGTAEYECSVPEANSNLVMFRDDFVDSLRGLRLGVIALTSVTANLKTGEIIDADIQINSRDEDFEIDGAGGVGVGQRRDLSGVINHELGHLLGLSHSLEPGALMRASYEGTTLPAADDAAGMCAALGRASSDPACDVPELPPDAGCVGSDTSCTVRRAAEDPDGCTCRVGGSVASSPPALLAWGTALVIVAFRCRRFERSTRNARHPMTRPSS